MKFEDFKLIPAILDALKDENYKEPTSIQIKSIPAILNGEDVIGRVYLFLFVNQKKMYI
jgi:superfamily II DNA/RNA helicase